MQKVIKIDNKVTVFLENGEVVEKEVTEDEFKKVVEAQTDEEVLKLLCPEYQKSIESHNNALTLIEKIQKEVDCNSHNQSRNLLHLVSF